MNVQLGILGPMCGHTFIHLPCHLLLHAKLVARYPVLKICNLRLGISLAPHPTPVRVDVLLETNLPRNHPFPSCSSWMLWSLQGECQIVPISVWSERALRGGFHCIC